MTDQHSPPDAQPLTMPWPVKTETLAWEGLRIVMDVPACFDDVLDAYAESHPDDTDTIPYFADIWPSARALSHYLITHPDCVQNRSVIELGCGLALPAIVAAKLGAASVVATDFHPACIPYCKANTIKNGVADIHCQTLDWRTPQITQQFDCIIGSDLLYEEPQIDALLHCITMIRKPQTQFILADPLRNHIQTATDKLQQAGWIIDYHPVDEILILIAAQAQ